MKLYVSVTISMILLARCLVVLPTCYLLLSLVVALLVIALLAYCLVALLPCS
jgi:hypothetical protein